MKMEKNKIIRREVVTPCTLCVREAEGEDSRAIAGRAIVFNSPSVALDEDEDTEWREVIAPEAVTREVLDASDIKMTMFHDRQLILARSKGGKGTLSYAVTDEGVDFEFEAPRTVDGDKALELVRRGDIAGCSFAFSTYYYDENYVSRSKSIDERGRAVVTITVRKVLGIYDFTLAADPAYPQTSVDLREAAVPVSLHEPDTEAVKAQISAMREAARGPLL